MKGVSYVTNEKNKKIAVQIDLKTLGRQREVIEDFLDTIIAESRQTDEDIDWTEAKKDLKKSGKL